MTLTNPFFDEWLSGFGIPPFGRIKTAHFEPAFAAAFQQSRAAIDAIAHDTCAPTFENTIEALENADHLMEKVGGVFWNLAGSDSTAELESFQRDLAPKLAAFQSETYMNAALFARIDALWTGRNGLNLTGEQIRVLEIYHRDFRRAGAELTGKDRQRLTDVLQRLAVLGTAFSQNLLADERAWHLEIASDEVVDLPDFLAAAAAAAAKERGLDGHVITLSRSLIVPFLQFCPRRDLRKIAFEAWEARGANGGETDNRAIAAETLALRQERASLLGYDSFAAYKLAPQMAKTPGAVHELLMAVWAPAKAQADHDAQILGELMRERGLNDQPKPWDWRYFSRIRRAQEYDLNEEEIKPYFNLDAMIAAAFDCAARLFGLTFLPLDIELYHSDAKAWEVRKGDRHMAVFIGDYFARPSKRSGAWCSGFRSQSKLGGEVRPITVNVCNFAKPEDGAPCLLAFDDATTLFHEFGHALHAMLSDVTFQAVSGTSVARDFVELPSQLFEHWLSVPDVLKKHARHIDTGAPMPADLRDRLLAARNFDQGFETVEYTSSALVDLDFHTHPAPQDAMARQAQVLADIGMPEAIRMRHATPQFAHVFSGDGYSSGYYSYMWSEVMDADAFAAFDEAGDSFDPATAARLATHIYSAGGSQDEAVLYTAFRGKMPGVDSLLRQRGLDKTNTEDGKSVSQS